MLTEYVQLPQHIVCFVPTGIYLQVELALAEAKADYKRFDVDLQNKPEWYAPKVNPASKVRRLNLFISDWTTEFEV